MQEIDFSLMIHTPQTVEVLRELMDEFERTSRVHVNLHTLRWEDAHAELNKIALYHHGPDISEIGSTWVSDLIAMNSLRPFSTAEIYQIGKPEDFIPQSWETCHLINDDTQWDIPWLAEPYVIHYRQDLLAKAGIDPAAAFTSHDAFARTAAALAGHAPVPVEYPLGLDQFGTLHVLASWLWSAGADFCAPDGRQVLFNKPEAISAIRAYFDVLASQPVKARKLMRERKSSLFNSGQAAVCFGTLMAYNNRASAMPKVRDHWQVAPLPGAHFLGGSNLVVWKHARNERAALDLIRFLASPGVQVRCAPPLATLPTRLEALTDPLITADPALSVFAESARTGRSYLNVPLWGLIEDRLVAALLHIGEQALSDTPPDLEIFLPKLIDGIARRLNITLAK